MKRNTNKKRVDVSFKIDIYKACDRVDWGYLRHIMLKLGFDQGWVNIIMLCVSTVRYSVILNDPKVGPITLSRGLRQGDQLSSYLFILLTKQLIGLI